MITQQHIIRDERASGLLEMMLVFAVATIFVIRAFLALTNYPQLGGDGLHIAHTLWGGLGMLVSIALLLSFWNPAMRQFAAALGGIGFGFFVDELGKFIAADVDYFFQPTIALLYILFIILFLAVRVLGSRSLTAAEISANRNIIAMMSAEGDTSRINRFYTHIAELLQKAYLALVSNRWFAPVFSTAFIFVAIGQIITIITLVTGNTKDSTSERHIPLLEHVASFVSTAFIVFGVILTSPHTLYHSHS